MTTLASAGFRRPARDGGFFLTSAIAMALVIFAGFSLQLAMGRSSFASPPLVHAHAVVFMGWVVIYLMQNVLAASGRRDLHRRLGWLAAGWVVLMIGLGLAVTLALVRQGRAPFFFRPLQFLVFDPASVLTFAGLTAAAIALRRRTEWHRRLQFCAMALLLGPGFGRLLPLPLMRPWAWEATLAASAVFPLIGVVWDVRRNGAAHPAWGWGLGAMAACLLVTEAVTYSPVGDALYRQVTRGTPGAAMAPLAFPAPPGGPPVAKGRTASR